LTPVPIAASLASAPAAVIVIARADRSVILTPAGFSTATL
jgi:hypothetical protein